MDHISSLPVHEQAQLARAWQGQADRAALERLMNPLLPRVLRLARRLSPQQAEDLAAEGTIALIEALGRWPVETHDDLIGFVWPAVRGAMLRARVRGKTSVFVPERKLRDGLSGRLGQEARDDFLRLIDGESFDEAQLSISSPASEDLALGRERARHLRRVLAQALRPLSRVERHLVIGHLLHETAGLESLAHRLDLSPARARALEGRALNKMRNIMIRNGFMKSDLA